MLKIKKYANGRFFDTMSKKYLKPDEIAQMIKNGEKFSITLTKTGKDITKTVIAQMTKKEAADKEKKAKDNKRKELPFLKTEKLIKWVGDMVDTKIKRVMDIVKLPSREQVAKLDENIRALNKKIDELKLVQEKKVKKTTAKAKTTAAPKAKPTAAPKAKEMPAKKSTATGVNA